MKLRTMTLLAMGAGFFAVSHALELRGDVSPFAEQGASTDRLLWHGSALIVLLAALGCFIAAGVDAFRKKRA